MSRRGTRQDRHGEGSGATALVIVDMLNFRRVIPTDAVVAIYDHLAEAALEMMERNLSAELCPAGRCALD